MASRNQRRARGRATNGVANPSPSPNTARPAPAPQDPALTQGDAVAGAVLNRTDTIQVPILPDPYLLPGVGAVAPGSHQRPGTQPPGAITQIISTQVESSAELGIEYIQSSTPRLAPQFGPSTGYIQAAGIHSLPQYIDELERDFPDIYHKMMFDAIIKSSVNVLVDSILDKPLQITSPCDPDTEKDKRKITLGENVAEFVNENFEYMAGGFARAARQLLTGIYLGYKVGELVWEPKTLIKKNGPQTVLTSINPKPQGVVSIIVDQYNHTLGYLPRIYGYGLTGSTWFGEIGTPTIQGPDGSNVVDIPGLIPPDKCICFTWMMEDDDPRGVSHIRAAYIPWRLKIGLFPAYEAYLARFAQPSAALELNGADPFPLVDSSGRAVKDPKAIINNLLNNLKNFQAGGAMVVPSGQVKLLQAGSNGQAYLSAYELVNEEITMAILYANLATAGGKYGTQALGNVHQDTSGLPVQYGKLLFADTIREQIVRSMVLYNYGEDGLAVLPNVGYGATQQQDRAQLMGAYAQMKQAALLFPQQYNDMFTDVGMEVLPEEIINTLVEQWQTETAAAVTMAKNPMGAPGAGGAPGAPGQAGGPGGGNGSGGGGNGPQNGSQSGSGQGSGGSQPDRSYY